MPVSQPSGSGRPRRRAVVVAAVFAVPAAAVLSASGCTAPGPAPSGARGAGGGRFFTAHEAAVVEAATARIAPGPRDDPVERDHPGAREADVTGYIDAMLGALGALGGAGTPPLIFAGGPWSNRHAPGPDLMASFARLDPVARIAWRMRLTGWRQQYRQGIVALDKAAGGDYTAVPPARQDAILARTELSTFRSLLFEHTVEGLYSVPEYGGNRGLAGWRDIGFPGDIQPMGYSAAEVEQSDGRDPVADSGVVAETLKLLGAI